MKNHSELIIYTRTKRRDYRFITPPTIPLNEEFIAQLLETQRGALRDGQVLFQYGSFAALRVFFFAYTSSRIDERGRKIASLIAVEPLGLDRSVREDLGKIIEGSREIIQRIETDLSELFESDLPPKTPIYFSFEKMSVVLPSKTNEPKTGPPETKIEKAINFISSRSVSFRKDRPSREVVDLVNLGTASKIWKTLPELPKKFGNIDIEKLPSLFDLSGLDERQIVGERVAHSLKKMDEEWPNNLFASGFQETTGDHREYRGRETS